MAERLRGGAADVRTRARDDQRTTGHSEAVPEDFSALPAAPMSEVRRLAMTRRALKNRRDAVTQRTHGS
jgi:hypothetical protein